MPVCAALHLVPRYPLQPRSTLLSLTSQPPPPPGCQPSMWRAQSLLPRRQNLLHSPSRKPVPALVRMPLQAPPSLPQRLLLPLKFRPSTYPTND